MGDDRKLVCVGELGFCPDYPGSCAEEAAFVV